MKDDVHNLSDEYPDLSDIDSPSNPQIERQPSKKVKRDDTNQQNTEAKKIIGPAFMGGGLFLPPPPPKQANNKNPNPVPLPIKDNSFTIPEFGQRERKNCIYIQNLAKSHNQVEKLTTFFRTFGNIKNIKTNEEKNSAVVRFHRQQDALNFYNSKTKVLNRTYIKYSLNEDIQITDQWRKQREKDQMVLNKPEKEVYILKDNEETILADKYRALLYLKRNLCEGQHLVEVVKEIQRCKKVKEAKKMENQLIEFLDHLVNPYDWSLCFARKAKGQLEKKKIIHEFIKYGPIGTLDIRYQQPEGQTKTDEEIEKLAIIKMKFLGIKSSWEMYKQLSEQLQLRVQGNKMEVIFNLWQSQKIGRKQILQAKENLEEKGEPEKGASEKEKGETETQKKEESKEERENSDQKQ